jgi:hypothetical protein
VSADNAMKGHRTSVHCRPVDRFSNIAGRFPANVSGVEQFASRRVTLPLLQLMNNQHMQTARNGLAANVASASRTVAD